MDLLTQSNCARYVEFKAVGKIYRVCEGCVEQVPCSRADLFSTQAVSMLEKRRMMKFLSFCADYTSQLDTVQGQCHVRCRPLLTSGSGEAWEWPVCVCVCVCVCA